MFGNERAPGAAFQVLFKLFREIFLWKGHVRIQLPRLEFVGVNRFSRVVIREALLQVAG